MKRKSPGSHSARAAATSLAAVPRAEGKRKVKTPPWMTITIDDSSSDEDVRPLSAPHGAAAAAANTSKRARPAGGSAMAASGHSKPASTANGSLQEQLVASQQRVSELQRQAQVASQLLVNVRAQLTERAQQVKLLQAQLNELEDAVLCPICMEQRRSVAFSCGHTSCAACSCAVKDCHTCRKKITKRLALF